MNDVAISEFNCPLCAEPGGAAFQESGRTFRHCATCELICVPAIEHLSDESQRERYALHDNTLDNTGYVAMLGRFIERLEIHAPLHGRLLDFGCGPNQVLVQLVCSAGYTACGHDPLYGIHGLDRGPFDAVVSTETIEHFASPDMDFGRMAEALRVGGTLVVTTHFHRGAESVLGWWYARDPTHVSLYSQATMSWIARRFGFDILEIDEAGFCAMRKRDPGTARW